MYHKQKGTYATFSYVRKDRLSLHARNMSKGQMCTCSRSADCEKSEELRYLPSQLLQARNRPIGQKSRSVVCVKSEELGYLPSQLLQVRIVS